MQQNPTADERRCAACDLYLTAPSESVIFASELWTATLTRDVPGWIMVVLNRHSDYWLWGLRDEALRIGSRMRKMLAAPA